MPEKTVLIVDDEEDMRIFVSTVMESSGFSPVNAHSGEKALDYLSVNRPDLIILDLMMSKIEDGG